MRMGFSRLDEVWAAPTVIQHHSMSHANPALVDSRQTCIKLEVINLLHISCMCQCRTYCQLLRMDPYLLSNGEHRDACDVAVLTMVLAQ